MEQQLQNNDGNQRRLKRFKLSADVDVVDREGQKHLGRLANVNAEGLMIIGDYVFQEDKLYQIDLKLPEGYEGVESISLEIDCLWTRPAQEDSNINWSGFSIVDVSDQAKVELEKLIEAMGI